ncbi:Cysteine rich receptor like kinase [Quillaja saponaria]|uniref:Cysteine rich receptor like kinase n=1 Tax=Quillaja saponaria TaxID=32244 RepID=A0AAD7KYW3_QUISA|nr:Cysteine rich receptor like kinase [Quillaja saponaria]
MSSSKFTSFLSVITFVLCSQGVFAAYVMTDHVCIRSENFTSNDPYETNLKELLTYLSFGSPPNGFGMGSKGEGPNRAYGFALCRGDLPSATCTDCLYQAINELSSLCWPSKGRENPRAQFPTYSPRVLPSKGERKGYTILLSQIKILQFEIWYDSLSLTITSDMAIIFISFQSNGLLDQGLHCEERSNPWESYNNASLNVKLGFLPLGYIHRSTMGISANASLNGFSNVTVGQNADTVYGLLQCNGELSNKDCETCANTAATQIRELCLNQKEASIGYIDCSLQYSNRHFFSTANSIPRLLIVNMQNASDQVLFNRKVGNLLRNLSTIAASIPSKFSVGSTGFTDFVVIYAMVQCTRDLTENNCLTCLQNIISYVNGEKHLLRHLQSLERNSTSTSRSGKDGNGSTSKIVVAVVVPVVVAVITILIIIICGFLLWRKVKRKGAAGDYEEGPRSMDTLMVDLSTLKVATGNFSDANELGQGGFGLVYKGKLYDGREIAVKRLSSTSGQEDAEKLLVYEYLSNGSLDKILFDQRKRFQLKWEIRYKIIVGIARGLLYLHDDSQLRIIHRDLKASNILLDENMNPKISDFGLARLFGGSQTQGNTNRIAGTYGYMAPEYAKNGKFSTKSDVYSFGVLVLEILTGRKNSNFQSLVNLQSYAWQHWYDETALEIIDPALGDQWPRHDVLKCIHIGLLCVQEAAADRPTVSDIVMMLSSYTMTSSMPSRPAFFIPKERAESDLPGVSSGASSGASQFNQSKSEPELQTVTE